MLEVGGERIAECLITTWISGVWNRQRREVSLQICGSACLCVRARVHVRVCTPACVRGRRVWARAFVRACAHVHMGASMWVRVPMCPYTHKVHRSACLDGRRPHMPVAGMHIVHAYELRNVKDIKSA
jgi:hypothetical protein